MNKPLLLSLIILLAAIKWVVMPVISWQNDKIDTITLEINKYQKVNEAISQADDYKTLIPQLHERQRELDIRFFEQGDNLKVNLQQQIEASLEALDIKVERFEWVLEDTDNSQIALYVLKIVLNGKLDDFISWQYVLANSVPHIFVQDLRVRRKHSSRKTIDDFTATLNLSFLATEQKKINEIQNVVDEIAAPAAQDGNDAY